MKRVCNRATALSLDGSTESWNKPLPGKESFSHQLYYILIDVNLEEPVQWVVSGLIAL